MKNIIQSWLFFCAGISLVLLGLPLLVNSGQGVIDRLKSIPSTIATDLTDKIGSREFNQRMLNESLSGVMTSGGALTLLAVAAIFAPPGIPLAGYMTVSSSMFLYPYLSVGGIGLLSAVSAKYFNKKLNDINALENMVSPGTHFIEKITVPMVPPIISGSSITEAVPLISPTMGIDQKNQKNMFFVLLAGLGLLYSGWAARTLYDYIYKKKIEVIKPTDQDKVD